MRLLGFRLCALSLDNVAPLVFTHYATVAHLHSAILFDSSKNTKKFDA